MNEDETQQALLNRINTTISRYELLPGSTTTSRDGAAADADQTPMVLMVSGGSDSMAMAHIMCRLYPRSPIAILHINHMLRGEDSDGDEA
ncbi:MAG: hypothetical protein LBM21_01680, partial [Coriobacteriales bacterium]|nr:hypothetical protein [Coriobacteriales bacterium]